MLIVQGSRDTFGTPEELAPVAAAVGPSLSIHVIEGGDHSFKVARAAGQRQRAIDEEVRRAAAGWMRSIMQRRTRT